MYKNIGNKICLLAKICGSVGVLAGAFGLVRYMVYINKSLEAGISLLIILGGVLLLLSSWFIYTFGQITNDVHSVQARIKENEADKLTDLPEL